MRKAEDAVAMSRFERRKAKMMKVKRLELKIKEQEATIRSLQNMVQVF